MDTEVLVVGGGATGVGVARDLALRGVDVTLAERAGLAGGATGRSQGVLHSGARYAASDPRGAAIRLEENRTLRRVAGACVEETGGLFVTLAADDPDHADETVSACRDVGIDVSRLGEREFRERVPGLGDGVRGVFAVPDAVVRSSRLVAATAESASRHGATVHTHAPVTDLHVEAGSVTGATLGGDVDARVEAETVVNAAGPWASGVAAMAGVKASLTPTRGVMVAVDLPSPGAVLTRCRPPHDGDVVVPHADEAVLGTTRVPVDDPDEFDRPERAVERTREGCAAMLPAAADATVTRTWWTVRPVLDGDGTDAGEFSVLDHGEAGVDGLVSVLGGTLTTHRRAAEVASDRVAERLGATVPCRTAEEPLPAADDPGRLDALVGSYDAGGPADADLAG